MQGVDASGYATYSKNNISMAMECRHQTERKHCICKSIILNSSKWYSTKGVYTGVGLNFQLRQ